MTQLEEQQVKIPAERIHNSDKSEVVVIPVLQYLHGHIQEPTTLCGPAFFSWRKQSWHICAQAQLQSSEDSDGAARYHRTRASSTATVRAWPTCRVPVTLGGGIQREKVWSTAWANLSWWREGKQMNPIVLCFLLSSVRVNVADQSSLASCYI